VEHRLYLARSDSRSRIEQLAPVEELEDGED